MVFLKLYVVENNLFGSFLLKTHFPDEESEWAMHRSAHWSRAGGLNIQLKMWPSGSALTGITNTWWLCKEWHVWVMI